MDGNFCHCSIFVLPTVVVFAATATLDVWPEAPFCLCPLPAHSVPFHLCPFDGRSGRLPQRHLYGSSQRHLGAAADALEEEDDFLPPFLPIVVLFLLWFVSSSFHGDFVINFGKEEKNWMVGVKGVVLS